MAILSNIVPTTLSGVFSSASASQVTIPPVPQHVHPDGFHVLGLILGRMAAAASRQRGHRSRFPGLERVPAAALAPIVAPALRVAPVGEPDCGAARRAAPRMPLGMMIPAQREPVMVAIAAVPRVGEDDVLVRVIADPVAAAFGPRELAGLAAEPAAAPGALRSPPTASRELPVL